MALPDERFEICHLLDAEARGRILPALRMRLQPCPLGSLQRVQALYFGEAPETGAEPRRRLRIRLHESAGRAPRCVVEVKHRVGLRSVVRLADVTLTDARALALGAPLPSPPGARSVMEEARDMVLVQALHPSILVAHDRLALVGEGDESDLRVTLDSALRWRTHELQLAAGPGRFDGDVLPGGEMLLVIKVARAVPSWLTLLLGRAGAANRSAGKHALAARAASAADHPADGEGREPVTV